MSHIAASASADASPPFPSSCASAPVVSAPPSSPPWSTLYADALHSIFKFAELHELATIMCVHVRWSHAVSAMPSIHANSSLGCSALSGSSIPDDQIDSVDAGMRCPLARHVSALSVFISSVDQLQFVADRMPWIRKLRLCSGQLLHWSSSLARFNSLHDLRVDLIPTDAPWTASDANLIIAAIGAQCSLETLDLALYLIEESVTSGISFAPLIALRTLRTFSLTGVFAITDTQTADLRAMASMIKCCTPVLVRMLQPGHALLWTTLRQGLGVTDELVPLIGSLPSLTELDVQMQCADVTFFSHLYQLTHITLNCEMLLQLKEELVDSLSHCTQLQSLSLAHFDLRSAHLERLLPSFPLLHTLALKSLYALDSLRCLQAAALSFSLSSLCLENLRFCPAEEVSHVFHLRSLKYLEIYLLQSKLSEEQRAYFTIPSARFTKLERVDVDW